MPDAPSGLCLEARALNKRFDGLRVASDLSMKTHHGEVHAVIGPNGAGKTTLIDMLSGLLRPDSGTVTLGGREITGLSPAARVRRGLARSFQITSIFRDLTVLENVILPIQARQGHSYRFGRAAVRDPVLLEPARSLLEGTGLIDQASLPAGQLAHGDQRQLELAIALATRPSILLLDEPMAGMGPQESHTLIDFLGVLKATHGMLLIEHDLDAVFALADRITVLVHGRVLASGDPDDIRKDRQVRTAYLGETGS